MPFLILRRATQEAMTIVTDDSIIGGHNGYQSCKYLILVTYIQLYYFNLGKVMIKKVKKKGRERHLPDSCL